MKVGDIGKSNQIMGVRERRAVLKISAEDIRQRKMVWEIANFTETI